MSKPIIWFDMDGVLVDLFGFVKHFLPHVKDSNNYQEGITEVMDETVVRFNLFEIINPKPDFEIGYRLIRELLSKKYDVRILSSISNKAYSSSIAYQKRIWLKKHELGHIPVFFVDGSEKKAELASGILIDDYLGSIQPWIAAGGLGILHHNFLDTTRKLDEILFGIPYPIQLQQILLGNLNVITK